MSSIPNQVEYVGLRRKINQWLSKLGDGQREGFQKTLNGVSKLPKREERRQALKKLLKDIEDQLCLQSHMAY